MKNSYSILKVFLVFTVCLPLHSFGQLYQVSGTVYSEEGPIPGANIAVTPNNLGGSTNAEGVYTFELSEGRFTIVCSAIGYATEKRSITVKGKPLEVHFRLKEAQEALNEVVVSGTLKEVRKLDSPVPVEVYSVAFLQQNPTANLFEAMQNINGVRPQLNCNVCNTGDIHINGLEGPYTMVLIDGMPIVSGLSTVYGLMGIPNSMIDRIEVVKGPASSLYGSEAVGGLINVITKDPKFAPSFSADLRGTSWLEYNADIGLRNQVGTADVLTGINFFNFTNPIDNNNDNFTDVTLQERFSLFQKWNLGKNGREFTLAGRYMYEDRYGGELGWSPEFRGGTELYGESIITNRYELLGKYQLPTTEKMMLWFSQNSHRQNSFYGDVPYMADQNISFAQLTWDKTLKRHSILSGAAFRYTYYDDNTTATIDGAHTYLPGLFVQDEITLNEDHTLLLGSRVDYNSNHGFIYTPRIAYKWGRVHHIFRVNAGTGFRVVNLFTEEHAALTGAREVVVPEALDPEQSYNVNLNYVRNWYLSKGLYISTDLSSWYTYFTNQILPNYDANPNQILYENLDGYAVSQGISGNVEIKAQNGLGARLGASFIDVNIFEPNETTGETEKIRPILSERWTGVWALSYDWSRYNLTVAYTGNLYGPMRLPLLGDLDPRADFSPWWSIQNIQLTWAPKGKDWELYGGVKNLLNFTPPANSIARANDPFDQNVSFDSNGNALPTANNPNALTFDPSYVFAPNQGIRGFVGFRFTLSAR